MQGSALVRLHVSSGGKVCKAAFLLFLCILHEAEEAPGLPIIPTGIMSFAVRYDIAHLFLSSLSYGLLLLYWPTAQWALSFLMSIELLCVIVFWFSSADTIPVYTLCLLLFSMWDNNFLPLRVVCCHFLCELEGGANHYFRYVCFWGSDISIQTHMRKWPPAADGWDYTMWHFTPIWQRWIHSKSTHLVIRCFHCMYELDKIQIPMFKRKPKHTIIIF